MQELHTHKLECTQGGHISQSLKEIYVFPRSSDPKPASASICRCWHILPKIKQNF